jgi:hypothetical protein
MSVLVARAGASRCQAAYQKVARCNHQDIQRRFSLLVAAGDRPNEAAFEHVLMSRVSHLDRVPGFVGFHLLKGPDAEDHTPFETAEWHEQSIMARPDTLDWNKSLSSWLGLKKSGGSHGSNNAGPRGSNNALPEMRKTNGPDSHHLRPHRPPMHKL